MAVDVLKKVEEILIPYLQNMGLRIYDMVFVKEGKDKVLRVFIDKEGGLVSIDECEEVSRLLSDELDNADIISEAYILEISSPGIERQLKYDWHFKENIGKKVQVKLYKKIEEQKLLIGTLINGSEKGDLTIDIGNKEIIINNADIIDVKIYFEFGGN